MEDWLDAYDEDELKEKIRSLGYHQQTIIKNILEPPPDPEAGIDKTSDKYKLLLKLLNKIIKNSKKLKKHQRKKIKNISDFMGMERADLIQECNVEFFEEMEDELFEHYDKKTTRWYRRKGIKNYILTFIRSACKEFGCELMAYKKSITLDNGKSTSTIYFTVMPPKAK